MHHAPALTLTLQPDLRWRAGLRVAGCAGLLVIPGWLGWHVAQSTAPSGSMLAAAALSALPSLWLLWHTRATVGQRSTLSWRPAEALWTLQTAMPDGPDRRWLGRIDCMVAGRDWLLLRHGGPGIPSTWHPIARRRHAAEWHALRCAVFNPGMVAPTAPAATSDE